MKNVILVVALFLAITIKAQDQKPQVPQIAVTGEGKVKVIPDQAVINVGFQNSGKDSKEVKTLNDEVVDKVIKYLKKSGIPATDYKTNNVTLYKSYDYEKKKQNFQASQTLSIPEVENLEDIVDKMKEEDELVNTEYNNESQTIIKNISLEVNTINLDSKYIK